MKRIIEEAEKYALFEIKKYGLPLLINFNISYKKGRELAEKLGVDSDIVSMGTILMDIKIGEAFSKGKLGEHVEMSLDAAREFLSKFDISEEATKKIIKCIEGHHDIKWDLKEAEICANADCYRFLLVRNWLAFFNSLGKRNTTFEENLKYAEEKADEKWKILSLEICKKELESHYKLIKDIIKKARTE